MGVDRSIPSLDLYRELEVDPGASPEAIEAAYRSLMKRHHPDRAGQDGLARAKRLNVAREWLVDPDRRARYDAAQGTRRLEALRSTTRPPSPGAAPASSPVSARRPAPTTANQAHPRRTGRISPVWSAVGLGSVAVVAIVAAVLVSGWGSTDSGAAGRASPGSLGDVTSTPSHDPTPLPTPAPAVSRTPGPTPVPTPVATPAPTSDGSSAPAGRADIRFTGMYAGHDVEPLGGTSGCSTTTERGGSVPTLTGFQIDSGARSGPRWQLTLTDLTVSWSMDIFLENTADALWWNSGVGVGSVTRTADGFAFDVVMTDAAQSIRAKGSVICR